MRSAGSHRLLTLLSRMSQMILLFFLTSSPDPENFTTTPNLFRMGSSPRICFAVFSSEMTLQKPLDSASLINLWRSALSSSADGRLVHPSNGRISSASVGPSTGFKPVTLGKTPLQQMGSSKPRELLLESIWLGSSRRDRRRTRPNPKEDSCSRETMPPWQL